MGYFINPVEEERCVFLSYAGEMSPRELAAARAQAQALLKNRRWARIVVDLTQLRSVLTGVQVFDFATGLAAQVPRDARVALVVRPDQVQDASLVEKIAQSDGVYLAYFLDPEEAAAWVRRTRPLSRQEAEPPPHLERQESL